MEPKRDFWCPKFTLGAKSDLWRPKVTFGAGGDSFVRTAHPYVRQKIRAGPGPIQAPCPERRRPPTLPTLHPAHRGANAPRRRGPSRPPDITYPVGERNPPTPITYKMYVLPTFSPTFFYLQSGPICCHHGAAAEFLPPCAPYRGWGSAHKSVSMLWIPSPIFGPG